MIVEVEGDILLSKAEVIVHGIAANDPMSEGLAKSLHERLPTMHKDFHHWCRQTHPKPGAAWSWSASDGVRIVNLITQEGGYGHGGRPGKASLKNLSRALRALKKMAVKEGFASIALPRLGTGVGGLDWSEVRPFIHQQLAELNIPVYVYAVYVPKQKAAEG